MLFLLTGKIFEEKSSFSCFGKVKIVVLYCHFFAEKLFYRRRRGCNGALKTVNIGAVCTDFTAVCVNSAAVCTDFTAVLSFHPVAIKSLQWWER